MHVEFDCLLERVMSTVYREINGKIRNRNVVED